MLELLHVALNFEHKPIPVGRLFSANRKIYFEFEQSFLESGLPISPLQLPLKSGTQVFDPSLFEGLPGVFNDSLPDGWGKLLFDRLMRSRNVNLIDINPLDRLAYVGHCGMGALIYTPDKSEISDNNQSLNLDSIAKGAHEVLDGSASYILDELIALNGSSAGARPKALIGVNLKKDKIIHGTLDLPNNYEHWLVKFANSSDSNDCGAIEYVYAQMAKLSGIDMPNTHLFDTNECSGYFAIQRFDRINNTRLHVHTACGLLHTNFRIPSLDYADLIKLTLILTKDIREVEKMFRLAVFNVLAHNRDDHAKNFTYTMNQTGQWKLSPGYDLTFSSGPQGEQSTTVMGEGKNPSVSHLLKLASTASIDQNKAQQIIDQCIQALQEWPKLAKTYSIGKERIAEIKRSICK